MNSIEIGPSHDARAAGAALSETGVVLLRRLLDPAALAELATEVRSAFESLDARRSALSEEDRRLLDRMEMPVPDPDGAFRLRIRNYRVLDVPRLREILAAAVGPFLWHFPPMIRRQTPQAARAFLPFHQDWAYTPHYRRFFTCWTTLTPCGRDAPGLEVFCSPVREDMEHREEGLWERGVSDERLRALGGRETCAPVLEPGDVVVFGEHTLHRTAAGPAMTRTRYSIDFRAVPESEIRPEVRLRRKFVDPRALSHV